MEKPRKYQMGWCEKCHKKYKLPLSANADLPALAQCDECFHKEMNALSEELRELTKDLGVPCV